MAVLGKEKFVLMHRVPGKCGVLLANCAMLIHCCRAVEVGRWLGQALNARPGQSGVSWVAAHGKEFQQLSDLAPFLGAGWEDQMQTTSTGLQVRLFVHARQLDDVVVKYNAATQVRRG
jgi:hypothetical protein